jgi:hypothetical protein
MDEQQEEQIGFFFALVSDWHASPDFCYFSIESHVCAYETHMTFYLFGFGLVLGYQYVVMD